jgi:RNA polymerase sigma-70 factor (ECF subfamily)
MFRDVVSGVLPLSESSTEELIEAIARQDRDAFARLFSVWAPRIKQFLRARRVDSNQAEELTQEVMLLVWRKATYFDRRRGQGATWLFTLSRNCLVDRVRRERRPEPEPADLVLIPSAATGAHDQAEASQDKQRLSLALDSLPTEQADVVRGAYFHGLSLSEVATKFHLPLGTVKTRARLALRRLRDLLGQENSQ